MVLFFAIFTLLPQNAERQKIYIHSINMNEHIPSLLLDYFIASTYLKYNFPLAAVFIYCFLIN